ncbi:uncharacterized protein LOC141847282 [Curcuma longa]|uniref:uncharacterized protein LOC141847282 n=1 Tax=Curcuma longa TaxID=136217 RepID=UPI003D9E8E6B
MVVVHVKAATSEEQQFLYHCSSTSAIDEVADAILRIHHLQSHIQSLSLLLRQRLLSGPSFSDISPDTALALERSLSEAEAYVSKDQVEHKRFLSPHSLHAHVKNIEKEVKIVQSKGFLDCDLPQPPDCEVHQQMQLWWAGKELVRGKRLCDYIGTNEKTKIVITLKPVC